MVHGCPGQHVQVIDGQGRLGRAEAGSATLAVTGPQGVQQLTERFAAEQGLGSRIGHGAMGQHAVALPPAGASNGPVLRGVSLSTGAGYRYPVQNGAAWFQ